MEGNVYTTQLKELIIAPERNADNMLILFAVMEYMPLTLADVLASLPSLNLSDRDIRTLLYNLMCCINYFHLSGLMHRDIKPGNILVDAKLNVKLCDFGYSRGTLQ